MREFRHWEIMLYAALSWHMWYYCFFIYSCISFQSDDAQDSKLIFVMVFKWQINTLHFKRTYCFSFFTSMNSFLLFLIQCVNCHLFVVNCDIYLQCTVWEENGFYIKSVCCEIYNYHSNISLAQKCFSLMAKENK